MGTEETFQVSNTSMQTHKGHTLIAVTIFFMLMVGWVSLAQVAAETDDAPHAPPVSIVTLLAQPANRTARRVQVSGFLSLDFEGHALYLHKEDYQEGLSLNSIYLQLSPEQEAQYKNLDKSYVTVEASFQKRRNSEDIFTGVLFQVREIRKTFSHQPVAAASTQGR